MNTSISAGPAGRMAHTAFRAAAERFSSRLNRDGKTKELISTAASLRDIQLLIEKSQCKYENEKKFPKARKWLRRAALTIHYYGSVIDVFAQISPEYVSLVWGSMKLVVNAAQNHQDTISLLSKALSQIGDSLSRVEFATNLYPTEKMRVAVETLYTHIFEFFTRAYRWYEEGWCRHLWHSITQPPKLQYKDILEDMAESSNRIKELSQAETQVEIREMNKKLTDIVATLAIHSSALVNTDQRLTDLQFSSITSFLLEDNLGDPMKAYQHCRSLSSRLSREGPAGFTNRFWLSPKLNQWSSARESKVVFLQGNAKAQAAMQEFCICAIDQLQDNEVPVLWVLPSPKTGNGKGARAVSPIDLVKQLIMQAMQFRKMAPNEGEIARICTQFRTIKYEKEWFQLLFSALQGIGPQCYIIVDLSILNRELRPVQRGFSWLSAFQELFEALDRGHPRVEVKVLLLNSNKTSEPDDTPHDLLIPVRKRQIPERMRKKMEFQQSSRNKVRGLRNLPRRHRQVASN